MKSILSAILLAALVIPGMAQTPTTKPLFIRGDMTIRYNTRVQTANGKPREGIVDNYGMKVNVSDSALFHGTIEQRPYIAGVIGTAQTGLLNFAIDCDVVNPANPSQTRNVGKMYGTVPVDAQNVYRFADGSLRVGVFGIGAAKGFESKFGGLALGKPPASNGMFEKLKQQALSISRQVNGKTVTIAVSKYDKMEFQQHVLAAGPVQIYPEVTVNGSMIYDYGRTAWHFQNVTITYALDGRQMNDVLSGNIRWVESPDRARTGEGEYQFDIRVNEPPPSETAVFAGATDEAAFFATDSQIPALSGTMKYKDTMSGESVSASVVKIDLNANKLTKQQTMYLCKLLLFSTIVPLNAE